MVKVNERSDQKTPAGTPVYRHASQTERSRNDAGGKIDRGMYENRTPRPAGTPTESMPFKHRNDER
jgi:hypothetical protein